MAIGDRRKGKARVPQQSRSEDAITRIARAVVALLASEGQGALTHRRVADVAGVSLATTTYYYTSKFELIADAQTRFLAEYANAFVQARERHRAGAARIDSLADLMVRAMKNAAGRHVQDTLAWCEIILDCARDERGHMLAREWFERMERIWSDILTEIGTPDTEMLVDTAIDAGMGILFVSASLQLGAEQIEELLVEGRSLDAVLASLSTIRTEDDAEPIPLSAKSRETRDRIIGAAATMLEAGEAATLSYSAIAQRAGLTSAAPAYHFASLDLLLGHVDRELLHRMTIRHAAILNGVDPADQHLTPADLLAAIFIRTVIENGSANIAGIQAWLDAARKPELRGNVIATVTALESKLARFVVGGKATCDPRFSFILTMLFIGRYIRALTIGRSTGYLARSRGEFERALSSFGRGRNPLLPPLRGGLERTAAEADGYSSPASSGHPPAE